MLRRWLVWLCAGVCLLPASAHAQQQAFALPPADWYAVVWDAGEDTLNWVSAAGTVATIQRPILPDEVFGGDPRMSLSADGRYMVLVSDLADGRQGIGFYDFAAGEFTQVHRTEAGERVARYSAADGRGDQVALGFATIGTGAWRIISFDYATGDAQSILSHDSPIAAAIPAQTAAERPAPRQPFVLLFDAARGVIHFHLTADERSAPDTAFAWYPDDGVLEPSPLADISADFSPRDGEPLFTFNNRTLPAVTGGANAVGRGDAINPQMIYGDGETAKTAVRWLAGGDWVGFLARGDDRANWQIIRVDEPPIRPQAVLSSAVLDLAGTPDGFLAVRDDGTIHAVSNLAAPQGTPVYRPPLPDVVRAVPPQIIGVSVSPTLQQVRVPVVAPLIAVIPPCPGTPAHRVSIGERVQVIGEAPLRVRATAGGVQIDEMAVGVTGEIRRGASCVNGYLWWLVRWTKPDGSLVEGWSAEGDLDEYYMMPIAEDVPPAVESAPEE
ncbi:MAG: hypothetical protein EA396_09685, partial [Anaerolineaceae bacterium]